MPENGLTQSGASKHTPGPWIAWSGRGPAPAYIIAMTVDAQKMPGPVGRFTVCAGMVTGGTYWPAIGPGGMSFAEAEANAHLIAAAPDLYEACRAAFSILHPIEGPADDPGHKVVAKLIDALAKAGGGK